MSNQKTGDFFLGFIGCVQFSFFIVAKGSFVRANVTQTFIVALSLYLSLCVKASLFYIHRSQQKALKRSRVFVMMSTDIASSSSSSFSSSPPPLSPNTNYLGLRPAPPATSTVVVVVPRSPPRSSAAPEIVLPVYTLTIPADLLPERTKRRYATKKKKKAVAPPSHDDSSSSSEEEYLTIRWCMGPCGVTRYYMCSDIGRVLGASVNNAAFIFRNAPRIYVRQAAQPPSAQELLLKPTKRKWTRKAPLSPSLPQLLRKARAAATRGVKGQVGCYVSLDAIDTCLPVVPVATGGGGGDSGAATVAEEAKEEKKMEYVVTEREARLLILRSYLAANPPAVPSLPSLPPLSSIATAPARPCTPPPSPRPSLSPSLSSPSKHKRSRAMDDTGRDAGASAFKRINVAIAAM